SGSSSSSGSTSGGSSSGSSSGSTSGSSSTGSTFGSGSSSGSSSSSSSSTPTPANGTTRVEDSDASVSYKGTWFRIPGSGSNTIMYSGGSVQGAMDVGSVATLSFNGTGV